MNYEIYAACIVAAGSKLPRSDNAYSAYDTIAHAKELYEEFMKQVVVGNAGADHT